MNLASLMKKLIISILFALSTVSATAAEYPLKSSDWNAWRTLPVYDDGRIMPLNTFARLVVQNICGSSRPEITIDELMLTSIETGLAEIHSGNQAVVKSEAERIRNRIQVLFPSGNRVFESYELLFSWIAEPEVWEFIPFLPTGNSDFRSEVLSLPSLGRNGKPIRFVAPNQLDSSSKYAELISKIQHRQMQEAKDESVKAENSLNEKVAVDLHNNLNAFRTLTFRDINRRSDIPNTFYSSLRNAQIAFGTASRTMERMRSTGLDRIPDQPANSESEGKSTLDARFDSIAQIFGRILKEIKNESTDNDIVSRANVEYELDSVLKLIDDCAFRSTIILESLYSENPQTSNLPNNYPINSFREDAIALDTAIRTLRRSTQAAYLSLFQTGRTLRVLPALYEDAIRPDNAVRPMVPGDSGQSDISEHGPWVSLNLVLNASPRTIRRFVDRDFGLETAWKIPDKQSETKAETPSPGEIAENTETIREAFGIMVSAYTGTDSNTDMSATLSTGAGSSNTEEQSDEGDPTQQIHIRSLFGGDSESYLNPLTGDIIENYPKVQIEQNDTPANQDISFERNNKTKEPEKTVNVSDESDQQNFFPIPSSLLNGNDPDESGKSNEKENFDIDKIIDYIYNDGPVPGSAFDDADLPRGSTSQIQAPSDQTEDSKAIKLMIGGDRISKFRAASIVFRDSLRTTSRRMESIRATMLPDDQLDEEIIRKTAYPPLGSTNAEFWYYRLNLSFWMLLTSAISIIALVAAIMLEIGRKYIAASSNKKPARNSKSDKREKRPENFRDYVNTGRETSLANIGIPQPQKTAIVLDKSGYARIFETILFVFGVVLLALAAIVITVGGIFRAYISGWAPVSNMYETIVLMALCAACLGLWFTMQPIISFPLARAWDFSSFPLRFWFGERFFPRNKISLEQNESESETGSHTSPGSAVIAAKFYGKMPVYSKDEIPERAIFGKEGDAGLEHYVHAHGHKIEALYRTVVALVRTALMCAAFWGCLFLSYHEYSDGRGIIDAVSRSFAMNDPIDWIVVMVCVLAIVWFIPRFLLTIVMLPFFMMNPGYMYTIDGKDGQNMSLDAPLWWNDAWNRILDRKTFVIVGAIIVLIAAIATEMNPKDFNPNIRPLPAVLRSNFWLVVHVIAIIVSYAAGLIAWLLAIASITVYIFGRYEKTGNKKHVVVRPPKFCDTLSPYINKMIRVAVLMLMIGTILGARWADYSWGRFWSWDVKEVWALITLLVLLLVLHGRIAKFYGEFGVAIGAVFGAIAIVMTWYGFNFVFNVGRHAYGHGDSTWATNFLLGFIVVNLAFCTIASCRYLYKITLK